MARIRVFMVFVFGNHRPAGARSPSAPTISCSSGRPKTVSIPTRQVVVAAADLDVGAELRKEDIRIIDWPANAVPANAISDPKDVIGRGHRAAGDPERADPAEQAGAGRAGRRAAAGHSARPARRVGARQRGHRRRRLRAARHPRRRRRDGEPDRRRQRHDLEGRADQRAGARGRHEDRARRRATRTSRCRSAS